MLGFTFFDIPYMARFYPATPVPPAPASSCVAPEFYPVLDENFLTGPQTASPALVSAQGIPADSYAVTIPFTNVSPVTASIWVRTPAGFDTVVGLFDTSNTLVASNDDGGWRPKNLDGFNSYVQYQLDQIGTYNIEVSNWNNDGEQYSLYIMPGCKKVTTTSIAGGLDARKVLYSQTGKKVFVVSGPASESKVDVFDPITNTIENSYPFEALYDAVYNSVNDRIYLWVSGSTSAQEQIVELNGDGASITATTTFAASPVTSSAGVGWLSCNTTNNQILMVSETSQIYYIFDCATRTIVKDGTLTNGTYPTYCSTQNSYYINHSPVDVITKLDAVSFSSTTIPVSSSGKISYLEDINLMLANQFVGATSYLHFIDPSIDTASYSFNYSAAFDGALFDPCTNAIVTVGDGNFRIFTTGSQYQPGGYIATQGNGFASAVFVSTSSRVYSIGHVNVGVVSIYSSAPTVLSASTLAPSLYKICSWPVVSASAVVGFPGAGTPSPEPEWNGTFTGVDTSGNPIYYFTGQSIAGVSASADHSAGWPGSLQFNFDYTRLVWNGLNTWQLDLTYNDGAGGGSTWIGTNVTNITKFIADGWYTASFGTPTHILVINTNDSCPAEPSSLPAYCVDPLFVSMGLSGSTTTPKSI